MKIAIGSDHAGFVLKENLREALAAEGFEVVDFGTGSAESTDYPDYAAAVAHAVSSGEAGRGILVCHTGIGMSIAANKVAGIRAAVAYNPEEVELTRRHNDANILAIGAHYTSPELAGQYVNIFLNTPFEGGRHGRRVDKMMSIEREGSKE